MDHLMNISEKCGASKIFKRMGITNEDNALNRIKDAKDVPK